MNLLLMPFLNRETGPSWIMFPVNTIVRQMFEILHTIQYPTTLFGGFRPEYSIADYIRYRC